MLVQPLKAIRRLDHATRLLILAMVLAAAAGAALLLDMPLARWIHAGRFPGDLQHLVKLSEVFAHGSGVLLIILAAVAIDPRHWRVLPRLLLSAFGAGLTADLLKPVLGRLRPEKFDVNLTVWESFLGLFAWRDAATWQEALSRNIQSFPSGHAATAAGLACALSRLYPQATWFFAMMTVLACFQRIESNAHYLSDVLAGAAIGVLVNLALEIPRIRRRLEAWEDRTLQSQSKST